MLPAILDELETHGLLLKTDAKLPNVCALLAGEPVRGSWWAHPQARQMVEILTALASHPHILLAKLISGKDTFIHRDLWPPFLAVAASREPWQLDGLDRASQTLLEDVEKRGEIATAGRSAAILEKRILVHGAQVHTAARAHGKILTSWPKWMKRSGIAMPEISPEEGRQSLENMLLHLNARYGTHGKLPWR